MITITTHVLDTALGKPAAGIPVMLHRMKTDLVGSAVTDADGRVRTFDQAAAPEPGLYRLRFDTAAYLTEHHGAAFYPEIIVTFNVDDADAHYHVPVLLSPFGYSTYRGS